MKEFNVEEMSYKNMEGDEIVMIEYEENERKLQIDNSDFNRSEESMFQSDLNSPSNSSEEGINPSMLPRKPGRKTDREREETSQRREWNDSEIIQLIRLWKDNDVLYNTHHPMYYVQTERKRAMEVISHELRISIKDVNDKMHSLRTYYCSQRQRTESLHNSAGEMKPFSRWKFYDQMSFLYESVTNRAAKNNINSRSIRKRYMARDEQPTFINLNRSTTQDGSYSKHLKPIHDMYSQGSDENQPYQVKPQERSAKHPHLDIVHETQQNKSDNITPVEKPPATQSSQEEKKMCPPDEMFANMVSCSLAQIPEGQEKEKLKLDIQTLIYNTRFKTT